MTGMTNRTRDAVRLLERSRVAGPMADLPAALVPASEAEAYAIQDASLRDEAVAGWKVAPVSAGKTYRCSPIAAGEVRHGIGTIPAGATAPEVEGEVGLLIGKALPAGATHAMLLNAVSAVCLAIEILDSRFADRRRADPLSALADFQSNAGLVVGPLRAEWRVLELSAVRPRFVTATGEEILPAKPMPSHKAVLDAVLWLAHHAVGRGRPLAPGQVIITGARVGPVPIPVGQTFRLMAEGFEGVTIRRD